MMSVRNFEGNLANLNAVMSCLQTEDGSVDVHESLVVLSNFCKENGQAKDYFRNIGGIEVLLKLLRNNCSSSDTIVENIFLILGDLVTNNESNKRLLTQEAVFVLMHNVLITSEESISILETALHFFYSLTASNRSAQVLARESRCLRVIVNIFISLLPRGPVDFAESWATLMVEKPSILWKCVTSAVNACLNNPLNDENQAICAYAIPHAVAVVQNAPDLEVVDCVANFLGYIVASNFDNQEKLAKDGGLKALFHFLLKKQKRTLENAPKLGLAIESVLRTVNLALQDNGRNVSEMATLGLIMCILPYLQDASSPSLKLQVAFVLSLCVEQNDECRRQFLSCGGKDIAVKSMMKTTDKELERALECLLTVVLTDCDDDSHLSTSRPLEADRIPPQYAAPIRWGPRPPSSTHSRINLEKRCASSVSESFRQKREQLVTTHEHVRQKEMPYGTLSSLEQTLGHLRRVSDTASAVANQTSYPPSAYAHNTVQLETIGCNTSLRQTPSSVAGTENECAFLHSQAKWGLNVANTQHFHNKSFRLNENGPPFQSHPTLILNNRSGTVRNCDANSTSLSQMPSILGNMQGSASLSGHLPTCASQNNFLDSNFACACQRRPPYFQPCPNLQLGSKTSGVVNTPNILPQWSSNDSTVPSSLSNNAPPITQEQLLSQKISPSQSSVATRRTLKQHTNKKKYSHETDQVCASEKVKPTKYIVQQWRKYLHTIFVSTKSLAESFGESLVSETEGDNESIIPADDEITFATQHTQQLGCNYRKGKSNSCPALPTIALENTDKNFPVLDARDAFSHATVTNTNPSFANDSAIGSLLNVDAFPCSPKSQARQNSSRRTSLKTATAIPVQRKHFGFDDDGFRTTLSQHKRKPIYFKKRSTSTSHKQQGRHESWNTRHFTSFTNGSESGYSVDETLPLDHSAMSKKYRVMRSSSAEQLKIGGSQVYCSSDLKKISTGTQVLTGAIRQVMVPECLHASGSIKAMSVNSDADCSKASQNKKALLTQSNGEVSYRTCQSESAQEDLELKGRMQSNSKNLKNQKGAIIEFLRQDRISTACKDKPSNNVTVAADFNIERTLQNSRHKSHKTADLEPEFSYEEKRLSYYESHCRVIKVFPFPWPSDTKFQYAELPNSGEKQPSDFLSLPAQQSTSAEVTNRLTATCPPAQGEHAQSNLPSSDREAVLCNSEQATNISATPSVVETGCRSKTSHENPHAAFCCRGPNHQIPTCVPIPQHGASIQLDKRFWKTVDDAMSSMCKQVSLGDNEVPHSMEIAFKSSSDNPSKTEARTTTSPIKPQKDDNTMYWSMDPVLLTVADNVDGNKLQAFQCRGILTRKEDVKSVENNDEYYPGCLETGQQQMGQEATSRLRKSPSGNRYSSPTGRLCQNGHIIHENSHGKQNPHDNQCTSETSSAFFSGQHLDKEGSFVQPVTQQCGHIESTNCFNSSIAHNSLATHFVNQNTCEMPYTFMTMGTKVGNQLNVTDRMIKQKSSLRSETHFPIAAQSMSEHCNTKPIIFQSVNKSNVDSQTDKKNRLNRPAVSKNKLLWGCNSVHKPLLIVRNDNSSQLAESETRTQSAAASSELLQSGVQRLNAAFPVSLREKTNCQPITSVPLHKIKEVPRQLSCSTSCPKTSQLDRSKQFIQFNPVRHAGCFKPISDRDYDHSNIQQYPPVAKRTSLHSVKVDGICQLSHTISRPPTSYKLCNSDSRIPLHRNVLGVDMPHTDTDGKPSLCANLSEKNNYREVTGNCTDYLTRSVRFGLHLVMDNDDRRDVNLSEAPRRVHKYPQTLATPGSQSEIFHPFPQPKSHKSTITHTSTQTDVESEVLASTLKNSFDQHIAVQSSPSFNSCQIIKRKPVPVTSGGQLPSAVAHECNEMRSSPTLEFVLKLERQKYEEWQKMTLQRSQEMDLDADPALQRMHSLDGTSTESVISVPSSTCSSDMTQQTAVASNKSTLSCGKSTTSGIKQHNKCLQILPKNVQEEHVSVSDLGHDLPQITDFGEITNLQAINNACANISVSETCAPVIKAGNTTLSPTTVGIATQSNSCDGSTPKVQTIAESPILQTSVFEKSTIGNRNHALEVQVESPFSTLANMTETLSLQTAVSSSLDSIPELEDCGDGIEAMEISYDVTKSYDIAKDTSQFHDHDYVKRYSTDTVQDISFQPEFEETDYGEEMPEDLICLETRKLNPFAKSLTAASQICFSDIKSPKEMPQICSNPDVDYNSFERLSSTLQDKELTSIDGQVIQPSCDKLHLASVDQPCNLIEQKTLNLTENIPNTSSVTSSESHSALRNAYKPNDSLDIANVSISFTENDVDCNKIWSDSCTPPTSKDCAKQIVASQDTAMLESSLQESGILENKKIRVQTPVSGSNDLAEDLILSSVSSVSESEDNGNMTEPNSSVDWSPARSLTPKQQACIDVLSKPAENSEASNCEMKWGQGYNHSTSNFTENAPCALLKQCQNSSLATNNVTNFNYPNCNKVTNSNYPNCNEVLSNSDTSMQLNFESVTKSVNGEKVLNNSGNENLIAMQESCKVVSAEPEDDDNMHTTEPITAVTDEKQIVNKILRERHSFKCSQDNVQPEGRNDETVSPRPTCNTNTNSSAAFWNVDLNIWTKKTGDTVLSLSAKYNTRKSLSACGFAARHPSNSQSSSPLIEGNVNVNNMSPWQTPVKFPPPINTSYTSPLLITKANKRLRDICSGIFFHEQRAFKERIPYGGTINFNESLLDTSNVNATFADSQSANSTENGSNTVRTTPGVTSKLSADPKDIGNVNGSPRDTSTLKATPGDTGCLSSASQDINYLNMTSTVTSNLHAASEDTVNMNKTTRGTDTLNPIPSDTRGLNATLETISSKNRLLSVKSNLNSTREDASNVKTAPRSTGILNAISGSTSSLNTIAGCLNNFNTTLKGNNLHEAPKGTSNVRDGSILNSFPEGSRTLNVTPEKINIMIANLRSIGKANVMPQCGVVEFPPAEGINNVNIAPASINSLNPSAGDIGNVNTTPIGDVTLNVTSGGISSQTDALNGIDNENNTPRGASNMNTANNNVIAPVEYASFVTMTPTTKDKNTAPEGINLNASPTNAGQLNLAAGGIVSLIAGIKDNPNLKAISLGRNCDTMIGDSYNAKACSSSVSDVNDMSGVSSSVYTVPDVTSSTNLAAGGANIASTSPKNVSNVNLLPEGSNNEHLAGNSDSCSVSTVGNVQRHASKFSPTAIAEGNLRLKSILSTDVLFEGLTASQVVLPGNKKLILPQGDVNNAHMLCTKTGTTNVMRDHTDAIHVMPKNDNVSSPQDSCSPAIIPGIPNTENELFLSNDLFKTSSHQTASSVSNVDSKCQLSLGNWNASSFRSCTQNESMSMTSSVGSHTYAERSTDNLHPSIVNHELPNMSRNVTEDNLACSTEDNLACSTEDNLACSTEDNLACSTEDNLACSTEDNLACSTEDNLACSTEDNLACSTEDNLACSTEDNLACSTEDNLACSTEDNLACSTEDNLACSTEDVVVELESEPTGSSPSGIGFARLNFVTVPSPPVIDLGNCSDLNTFFEEGKAKSKPKYHDWPPFVFKNKPKNLKDVVASRLKGKKDQEAKKREMRRRKRQASKFKHKKTRSRSRASSYSFGSATGQLYRPFRSKNLCRHCRAPRFTKVEDALLRQGYTKYGYDWNQIKEKFEFSNFTPNDLRARWRYLVIHDREQDDTENMETGEE